MTKDETIKRLEQAIYDFKEATEFDERSSVIQSLIEDLEEEGKDIKEIEHVCCDGECNHDACCGKIPENCPLKNHD